MGRERARGVSATSFAIVAIGVAVLLLVPLLPEAWLLRELWAFEHLRDWPLALRLAAAGALVASSLSAVRSAAVRAVNLCAANPQWRAAAWIAGLPLLLVVFASLRQRNLRLGDGALLTQLVERRIHEQGVLVTYDEPLELYLHSLAYRALHAAFEWDVASSYALLSCLAGVAFVSAMVWLWRGGRSPVAMSAAVVVSLATPSLQLFFGYVENYSLVAVAALVYMIAAVRSVEGRLSVLVPALLLGVAMSFHVLAGWLGPTLLYVYWRQARDLSVRGRVVLLAAVAAAAIGPIAFTIGWMTAVGVPLGALGETHLAALKFIFLVEPDAPYFVYAAWSAAHWRDIANQWLLTSLAPLLAVAAVLPALRAGAVRGDGRLALFGLAAGFLHLFAMTWNAENGAANDWDLFALAGFFDAMFAARLVQMGARDDDELIRVALPTALLGFALTASFVAANAGRTLEIPPGHARAHLRAGLLHSDAGRSQPALRDFAQALRIGPEDAEVIYRVGVRLWNDGERERSTPLLQRFIELLPDDDRSIVLRAALAEEPR